MRSPVRRPRSSPHRARSAVVGLLLVLIGQLGAACSAGPTAVPDPGTGSRSTAASGPASAAPDPSPTTPIRQGHPARESAAFTPTKIVLPGHESAAVVPAPTVDGVLQVPEDVRKVGWWDGSAQANDPFGATVIAGHVDSATQGLGFFSRLLRLRPGERITVSAGSSHHASYVITSVNSVLKGALSSDSAAFDQNGDHRLVLITCTGAYIPSRGGYQNNLVISARPA